MPSGIWRFAVAPSNAASKNCNIGARAQLQSLRYITAPKLFWKIYHLRDFRCAQTCSFRAVFRLDALALSVVATATWLGGWVGGWVSVTAGIVSKRLNLSGNFLDRLVAPSFRHLEPLTPIPNSKGNPFIGALNTGGGGNWRFSFDFRRTSPFISETVRDMPILTMER